MGGSGYTAEKPDLSCDSLCDLGSTRETLVCAGDRNLDPTELSRTQLEMGERMCMLCGHLSMAAGTTTDNLVSCLVSLHTRSL